MERDLVGKSHRFQAGQADFVSHVNYKEHFDWVAENDTRPRWYQRHFHRQIQRILGHHIPEGKRVVEWGCGGGSLLASLRPSHGLGLDLSPKMIEKARNRFQEPGLEFRVGDLSREALDEEFDDIVLDYLLGYVEDIQKCLENLHASSGARTRLYITSLNTIWKPILRLGQIVGAVVRQPPSNWLSLDDLINLVELSGWEVVTTSSEQLFHFDVPLVTGLFNRFLVRLPFLRHFGTTLLIVARPQKEPELSGEISCSVIVPVRNEAGNIRPALERVPTLGKRTEIIFVEGNSSDDTWEVVQRETGEYSGPHQVSCCRQPGKGKWDAVFTGFSKAKGDVLVIQDGDLTAPPEDLPKFFEAVIQGKAEFANGSRLVYPMEDKAMRFLNLIGNKLFALALSFVIRQPIKDSLCGTKMLLRSDYESLLKRIEEFGDFDPFGDFNLLFGSSLLDLKIRDIPVRYRDRSYGETNISRFRHGWILLKMTWFGLRKLRFHR